MKYILSCLLIFINLLNLSAQSIHSKIDSLIQAYAAINKFNGNIVITRYGKTIIEGSYGYRDISKKIKLSGDDTFQIASLTKTFTAVLILKLIEEKQLSLDTRITEFFPKIHPETNITIAHLLNHTSGIREVLRNESFKQRIISGKKTDRKELVMYFSTQPLDFEPGSTFSYSNSGYDLLGFVAERVTGMDYGSAVKRYLFTPLGMTGSGFDYLRFKGSKKTVPYEYISTRRQVLAPIWDWSWTGASGGLYTNMDDLLKWNDALKYNRVISANSLEKSYERIQGDYGLGWFIDSYYGKTVAYHPGNLEGATSYFGRIPQDDICIIMLINQTSTWIETIAAKLIAILYEKPYTLPVPKQSVELSPEMLKRYAGRYDVSSAYQTVILLLNNQLYLQTAGQKPFRIYAENENKFFVEDSNMSIAISADKAGKLTLVIRDGLTTKSGEHL
ncbi:serine hydrolase domain-containing protein [Pedobacter jeongneungensis]|uniref:serine hydrolase domain-containing protein n=1 Tax=Pedobacter jeongneungensis TaxID=947309 RepID=UPI000B045E8A|nr:serine hydrolase domain-containing protein [Pedobacter jeongneungensis]